METNFYLTSEIDEEVVIDPDEQQAIEMEQLICTHTNPSGEYANTDSVDSNKSQQQKHVV